MKKSRGFTLIEIVIVIGIIGLLMVVLVPSITSSWNTNNMKAARLQAERVAKSIRVGILAGDIKTEASAITAYTSYSASNTLNVTLNRVNYIGGIDTLYESPNSNEDLIDPTSTASTTLGKIFWIKNNSGKIQIYNADKSLILYQEP